MDNTCNDTNKNVPIKTRNAYRKKWVKEELFIWSIWVIPIFMFLLMTIGGTANNFALMFQKFDPETKTYVGYGFGNFVDVWNDILSNPLIGISIKNSVIIWLMNTLLLFPIEAKKYPAECGIVTIHFLYFKSKPCNFRVYII